MKNNAIWVVGAGPMAVEYAKVLKDFHISYKFIGRGKKSLDIFKSKTGIQPYLGGLENFLLET